MGVSAWPSQKVPLQAAARVACAGSSAPDCTAQLKPELPSFESVTTSPFQSVRYVDGPFTSVQVKSSRLFGSSTSSTGPGNRPVCEKTAPPTLAWTAVMPSSVGVADPVT